MQDCDQEVTVTCCRLEESLVDEAGAALQIVADEIEHAIDHVAGREDLAVGSDAVPRLHQLLLDDGRRHGWTPDCLLESKAAEYGVPPIACW